MNLQEITHLAEVGLHVYSVTKDPLTLSAVKIAFKCKSTKLTEPEKNAVKMLQLQIAAYRALYTDQHL